MAGGGGRRGRAKLRLELERSRAGGEECCCDKADELLSLHGFRQVARVEKRARPLFMLSVLYGVSTWYLGKVYAKAAASLLDRKTRAPGQLEGSRRRLSKRHHNTPPQPEINSIRKPRNAFLSFLLFVVAVSVWKCVVFVLDVEG